MENVKLNADKGLGTQNINFFFPAGGGDFNSVDEIFDYWYSTGFGYSISCREYDSFRAGLLKQPYGGYELHMFDNTSDKPYINIPIGQRLTENKRNQVMSLICDYINRNYVGISYKIAE